MPRIAITPTTAIADYEEAIRRAGGDVWRLSFTEDRVEEVVQHADGVLLTGGGDVDPALYGASPHPTFDPAEPGRDAYELALVRAALAARRPILAICRGIQILNVARGGTLIQHIPDDLADPLNHRIPQPRTAHAHDVWITRDSLLDRLLHEREDDDTLPVNSRHHQAIHAVGSGLVVTATAPDGVIEAVEDPALRFCLGVQWHPENYWRTGEFSALFAGLITAADDTTP
jgi:putative glutamine amidotransferase